MPVFYVSAGLEKVDDTLSSRQSFNEVCLESIQGKTVMSPLMDVCSSTAKSTQVHGHTLTCLFHPYKDMLKF